MMQHFSRSVVKNNLYRLIEVVDDNNGNMYLGEVHLARRNKLEKFVGN